MKDLSLFLLKNNLGAKMKKGIRNLCNGDGSTSTLNQQQQQQQQQHDYMMNNENYYEHGRGPSSLISSGPNDFEKRATKTTTLEEMILKLEFEEEIARKAKQNNVVDELFQQRRMSCVNNSDILRSARNALNQYPRFSLDGKDSMYRSSFQHLVPPTMSSSVHPKLARRESELQVMWCKPGVVAKLMGLEAMPVTNKKHTNNSSSKERLMMKKKNQSLRMIAERRAFEKRSLLMNLNGCASGYCSFMKPIAIQPVGPTPTPPRFESRHHLI